MPGRTYLTSSKPRFLLVLSPVKQTLEKHEHINSFFCLASPCPPYGWEEKVPVWERANAKPDQEKNSKIRILPTPLTLILSLTLTLTKQNKATIVQ